MTAAALLIASIARDGTQPQPSAGGDPDTGAGASRPRRDQAIARLLARAQARRDRVPRLVTPAHEASDSHFPVDAPARFDDEVRDPHWAPAMEAALARRLAPAELQRLGIAEVEVRELTCRQVTCRLVYDYPVRVEERLAAAGLPPTSPLVLVEEDSGPPAPINRGWTREELVSGGERRIRFVAHFGYDAESYDPARHDEWARARLAQSREFLRQARASWQRGRGAEASPRPRG